MKTSTRWAVKNPTTAKSGTTATSAANTLTIACAMATKRNKNHVNRSTNLVHHPKRLMKEGMWKPGKRTPNLKKKTGAQFKKKEL